MPPRDRDPDDDPAPEYEPEREELTQNEKSMGLLAHLLGLFTWVVGPAVLLFTHGDRSPFVARHAKESLNCQVMQVIYATLGLIVAGLIGVAVGVVAGVASVGFVVGLVMYCLLAVAYYVFEIVCVVKASVAASNGRDYRYPLTVRLF